MAACQECWNISFQGLGSGFNQGSVAVFITVGRHHDVKHLLMENDSF